MFSMLRPVTATFRPQAAAASMTCWMRWTLLAKVVTIMRFLQPGELPDKRLAHGALAHGIARALHVGGVRQQGQDTLLAQGAEPGQVDDLPVDGSGVDLEVSGVNHGAHAGMDGEGHGVGDGVVHMDELHLELAGLHGLACLHRHQLGAVQQPVLLELQLDESGGEAGAVNGHVDLLEHIGDGPDVILVAMGDEQAPQPGLVFHQIATHRG